MIIVKKQPGINCHSALGKHMCTVPSARYTTASFHKETASRRPIDNDSEIWTGIPQQYTVTDKVKKKK